MLRAGQEVTVVGTVQQKGDQTVIARAKGQPLVVAPGDIPDLAVRTWRQSTGAWVGAGLLGLLALCLLSVTGVAFIRALATLLRSG